MKLNEKIYTCRKKAGLSQVDLADALGVSRQSVSKWETGEANPEVTKIPQLAKLFGVTADWLLSEEEEIHAQKETAYESVPVSTWPDWVENLPGFLGDMVKRFGWIFGVRLAVSGGLFAAIGVIARIMFRRMLFGFSGSNLTQSGIFVPGVNMGGISAGGEIINFGGFDPFTEFNNTAWGTASIFTGFIIVLGLAIMAVGIILAVKLKKWGESHG